MSLFVATVGTEAHTGAWIDSPLTVSPPMTDGAMAPGEWSDAAMVDLAAIPGNGLPAWLLVKNDATLLYIAYDAVGDTTADAGDSASVAFDTDHDLLLTAGREDQFFWGDFVNGEEHWVSDGFFWFVEDSPFNTALPNHAGLASGFGFGTSDLSATPHRTYELQIPLVLLGVVPGDVVGFLGASQPAPGVVDASTFTYSTWPGFLLGPPPQDRYGDLRLGQPALPVDLDVNPPSQSESTPAGSSVTYPLTVANQGAAPDVFDMSVPVSTWTSTLLDATGLSPLPDTDGDTIPDTGPVAPGGFADINVRIDVPGAAMGCDDAVVVATSDNDVGVSDFAILHTCLPGAAILNPPHADMGVDTDVPPNGLSDILQIDVGVIVNVDGFYEIDIILLDQAQTVFITFGSEFLFLSAGPNVVPVSLSGTDIYASGIDGPYAARIALYDEFFVLLDEGSHTTAPYLFTDFDPPLALFNPPHVDFGEDTDVPPDGLFDLLVIDVGVTVNEAGPFTIDGALVDPAFNLITFAATDVSLGVGMQVVRLEFLGRDIFSSGFNGPYTAFLDLSQDFTFLDSDTHVTAFYAATDFDPPPATFGFPHGDQGVDLDLPPDGLFEFLQVDASVDVVEAGRYSLFAVLWDSSVTFLIDTASSLEDLGPGLQQLPVRFSGIAIRDSGIDGPYTVDLYLSDAFGFLDYNVHVTGPYTATGFSPRGAQYLPPHTDSLLDLDVPPDGLADVLELDVGVDVLIAGTYAVSGLLVDLDGPFIDVASDCDALPVGPAACALAFDGHEIARRGADGPYVVILQMFDAYGRLLDEDFHFTAPYLAAEFEPPDGTEPTASAGTVPSLKNRVPLDVPYTASDPAPTDGLASVTLHHRFSTDEATWGPWTPFLTVEVSGNMAEGSVPFTFPDGPGFYEFQVTAADVAGNTEPIGAAEVRTAFRPLAALALVPATVTFTAGEQTTVTVQVLGPDGQPAVLESPLSVDLVTLSPGGEFRQVGTTTAVTGITIPAGQSSAAVDYFDTAAGTWDLRASSSETVDGIGGVAVSPGPPVSVVVDPSGASLEVGVTLQLSAQAFDAFANSVAASFDWSADPAIGTISATGLLTAGTAVASGTVTASVSGAPSVQGSSSVTLVPGPAAEVRIHPNAATIHVGTGVDLWGEVVDAFGNVIPDAVISWTVVGPGTLSSETGSASRLSMTSAGTATVTATSGPLTASATITAVEEGLGVSGAAGIGIGGIVGGVLVGLVLGRFLRGRRKGPENRAEVPPPPTERER